MRGQNNSKPVDTCPICKGDRFVCENHPRLAWPSECSCGAGDPCPVCNIAEPQVMPDDFVVDEEALDAALKKTANSAFLDETSLPGRRTAQKRFGSTGPQNAAKRRVSSPKSSGRHAGRKTSRERTRAAAW
jgi:hypothetical protein